MGGFPSPFHIERGMHHKHADLKEMWSVIQAIILILLIRNKKKKYVVKSYMVVVVTSITYYEQLSNHFYNTGTRNRSNCVKLHFIMQYSLS